MKTNRLILFTLALLFTTVTTLRSQEPTERSPVREIQLLAIGNSFSESLKQYLVPVTESVPGCKIYFENLYIGGCPLSKHWENIEREAREPEWHLFPAGSYQEILRGRPWDFVSIQQASHLSWQPESYEPWAKNLVDFIHENAPKAEIIMQQTWSYRNDDPRLARWGLDPESMYQRLAEAYALAAKELNLRLVPTGKAVQLARKNQPGGYRPISYSDLKYPDLPDESGYVVGALRWSEDHSRIHGDTFHLNPRGAYLQACVWFEFLFQRDAREITFVPDGFTEKDAQFLRESAHNAFE